MANGPSQKRDPHSVLIALAILSMVGFLVLYFKVDLDASLAAGDAARLSQQLANVENRLMKMGMVKTAPVAMPVGDSDRGALLDWADNCTSGVVAVKVCGDYAQKVSKSVTGPLVFKSNLDSTTITCASSPDDQTAACKAIIQSCDEPALVCPNMK